MTFTQEQLIDQAREKLKKLRFAVTQTAFTSIREGLEFEVQIAEIALAALESRSDADQHIRREVNVGGNTWVQCSNSAFEKAKSEGKHVRELYERPQPAPVIQDCPKCGGTGMADSGGAQPWGEPIEIPCDCRAAILQAEPVTTANKFGNSPVIPDGYVMVPKEPTAEMLAAAKEWTGLTSTAEVVYIKMLAAAPQDTHAMSSVQSVVTVSDTWIPVSERNPDDIGRYWCYVEEQNDLGKSHYQWNCSWSGDRWWVGGANSGRVTHWVPLPAAPQQEKE